MNQLDALVLWICRPNLNLFGMTGGAFRLHADVLIGVIILIGAYLIGAGVLRARGIELSRRRRTYLLLALLLIMIAEVSPLHDLAEGFLLSAHMIQHVLLVYILPPLLLAGLPPELYQPLLNRPTLFKITKVLTHPVVALLVGNAVYAIWHVPFAYQAALIWHEIHIFEHITMVGSALLMWWPFVGPVKELDPLSRPAKMLYLFMMNLGQLGVFAYVTFNTEILYVFYATAPRLFGLSPEADQVLAGVVMKVAMAVILLPLLISTFFGWVKEEERKRPGSAIQREFS